MSSIDLHSPTTKKLVSIITFSFLITFACSRLFVYLVLGHLMPDFFLTIKGVHIHHFTYGLFILVFVGLYLILKRPELGSNSFRNITIIYGIGLGLTFDEFGMWIRLEDDYWVRQSYDAVIIVTLLLVNIAYHKTLFSWLKEAGQMTKRIFKK
jgi:hypothetical protein